MNLYTFSIYSIISIIIFCTFITLTNEIGFRGPIDRSNIFADIEGDAPNSSICRRMVSNFTEPEIRCLIAKHFPGCQFDTGFLQYLVFQYCNFNKRIAPTIFMVFWLVLLLGAFATISDSFFSTSLIALARSLRMSQNLAGVTLLAFGNGAPDVFSAVTAITTGDPDAPDEGLGLGFLLGSGLLVNTVTAGLVIFLKPFKMSRRPFLKDTIFYMIAVSWAASILIRRKIYFTDAIGFLVFYLVYVVTTWASGTYMQRQRSYGTHSIIPLCLQKVLSKPLNALSRKRQNVVQNFKQICPDFTFLARIRKKMKFYKTKKSKSIQNHVIIDDRIKTLHSDIISEQVLPEKINSSSNVKVNGTIKLKDEGKVIKPNIHISDKRMNSRQINTPKIEITTPTDVNKSDSSCLHQKKNGSNVNNESPYLSSGLSDFNNYLNPTDGVKKRASSLVSTESMSNDRRLSSVEHSGLGRGRCRRTQSVFRRRPSSRMSSTGYELSYMVRWIIANRELKDKALGSRDGEARRSQKSSPYDPEEPPNENTTSGNKDLLNRKGSHHTPNLSAPSGCLTSPTLSNYSVEEDGLPKSSVSLKKIKLHFPPSDLDTSKQQMLASDENDRKFSNTLPKVNSQEGDFKEYDKNEKEATVGEDEEEDYYESEEMEEEEMSWLQKWATKGVWHHFAYYMIPIDVESWHQQSIFSRFLQILQTPIFIVFRLTIPTVIEELTDDTEKEVSIQKPNIEQKANGISQEINKITEENKFTLNYNQSEPSHSTEDVTEKTEEHVIINLELMHGWCKPLNVFQCLLVPALWPMLLTANGKCIGLSPIGETPIPIFCPFLVSGFIIALIVFFTSKWNQPPQHYHRPFFATLGFVTSIIWIYALAHELVNSLETLGIVWEISEAILGLSVMALASSIGDIMSNCLLARNGYPRIAYAACLGSPLFNLLLGAGLSYTIKIGRAGVGYANLSFTLTQALLFSCLLAVLTLNILTALIGRFNFRRHYGIVLIIIYLIFVTIAILIEVDIIVSPVNWHLATGTE
ncbi:Mitochondrial sodium/calcium exchanger protein [Schistosoma japonicum]|nr:Mitochondrial sodium/calcium exchanger protein [Schistosoma japonicum]